MKFATGTLDHRMYEALTELQGSVAGVLVAAVISKDGLPLASTLRSRKHEEKLAAMSASMHLLGDRISNELMASKTSQVIIMAEKGAILLEAAGREAVLLCIARRDASLGLVLHRMKQVGAEIAAMLDSSGPEGRDWEQELMGEEEYAAEEFGE